MGSTLFERFYQSNKVSELEQSARAIRAAYQENSGEIYDAIGKLENGNAIVSLFEIGGDGRVQMRYHSRTGREEMRPWGDRENAPQAAGEDVDRFQEKMLARLRDSDESFDVRLEESFNPWEDDGCSPSPPVWTTTSTSISRPRAGTSNPLPTSRSSTPR